MTSKRAVGRKKFFAAQHARKHKIVEGRQPELKTPIGGTFIPNHSGISNHYELKKIIPPIGSIIAWVGDLAGVPAPLPEGWTFANGSVVNDPESPLDGVTLPSLNVGQNRFLRGNNISGGTGGSATHTHDSGTLSTSGPDSTLIKNEGTGAAFVNSVDTHTHDPISGDTGSTSTLPPYYNVTWIIRIK